MDPRPLLLFDGVCNLCHASVRWVIARDRGSKFDFASLQSQYGQGCLREAGLDSDALDSVVVIDERGAHTHSNAAIAIARNLGLPWSLVLGAKLIPRFLRDFLYRWIAANRYRWFGKKEACSLPSPELRKRFLDADEPPPD